MKATGTLRHIVLGVAALAPILAPAAAQAQFSLSISVGVPPPALPVYVQPACPAPNYIWTPGFWAWGDGGYYWVPGTWVMAPRPGLLWTPGYWGWGGGGYLWHSGYWGPHVGFYGGINYGFGYGGSGFVGGAWHGPAFAYNTAVVNVNRTNVTNVYVDKTVIHNTTIINNNRTSFNGGSNGVQYRPNVQEQMFEREQHEQPTSMQTQHLHAAQADRANFASVNHGIPAHAAMARPAHDAGEMNRSAVPANQPGPANRAGQQNMGARPERTGGDGMGRQGGWGQQRPNAGQPGPSQRPGGNPGRYAGGEGRRQEAPRQGPRPAERPEARHER